MSDSAPDSSFWKSRYSESNKRRKRKHGSTFQTLDGKKRTTSEECTEKNGVQLYNKPSITGKGFKKRLKKEEIESKRDKELVVKNDVKDSVADRERFIERTNHNKKKHKRRKKEIDHYDIDLDKQECEWVEKVP